MNELGKFRASTGVWLFSLMLVTAACAKDRSTVYQFEFEQDVSVALEDGQVMSIKRGQALDAPALPIAVSRPDFKTVVLLPVPLEPGTIKIKLPHDESTSGFAANQITRSIIEIQKLIIEELPDEALQRIQKMKEKYPGYTYAAFLEASCYLVKRDFDKAREITEQAMKEFPDDSVAPGFLKEINAMKVK